jgi:hypothetical protein
MSNSNNNFCHDEWVNTARSKPRSQFTAPLKLSARGARRGVTINRPLQDEGKKREKQKEHSSSVTRAHHLTI